MELTAINDHKVHVTTTRKISQAELEENASSWIRVGSKVINVKEYIHQHPGGSETIKEFLGEDATQAYNLVRHSVSAMKELNSLVVGEYDGSIATTEVQVARLPEWNGIGTLLSKSQITHDTILLNFRLQIEDVHLETCEKISVQPALHIEISAKVGGDPTSFEEKEVSRPYTPIKFKKVSSRIELNVPVLN